MIELILLFFGLFIALVIDIIWWTVPSLSKSKIFQSHEHYHISLELIILAIILEHLTNTTMTSTLLLGMAFGFLLGEWDQLKVIKNKNVIPGKPFAFGSSHFKKSSIIGIILVGVIILLSILLGVFL